MIKEIAKIKSTMLGVEDHGIFTSFLTVDYGGSGQGIGGYSLDGYNPNSKIRVGTAFGMEFIKRTLKAANVETWEKLPGKTIFVLKEGEEKGMWGAKVIGIEGLPTEGGYQFLFEDLSKEFSDDAPSS